jgi:hypothetical protein
MAKNSMSSGTIALLVIGVGVVMLLFFSPASKVQAFETKLENKLPDFLKNKIGPRGLGNKFFLWLDKKALDWRERFGVPVLSAEEADKWSSVGGRGLGKVLTVPELLKLEAPTYTSEIPWTIDEVDAGNL